MPLKIRRIPEAGRTRAGRWFAAGSLEAKGLGPAACSWLQLAG